MKKLSKLIRFVILLSISTSVSAFSAEQAKKPIVIAHRGASGYRPEHTLAAYELAIDLGADYVEPDLVSTKDGVLVARHENEISGTTDVADHPEFKDRYKTKDLDGVSTKGWWTEDFTLAELKTLRARERLPKIRQHNTMYNGRYEVPTFQEIIDLVKRKSQETERQIGIYPEIKHPSYFAALGLSPEQTMLELLKKNNLDKAGSLVFIQCFEPSTLKRLHTLTKLPLIQLVDDEGKPFDWVLNKDPRSCADMVTEKGLAEIATYAQGIGPNKNLIVPRDKEGKLQKETALVANAHKNGLLVHPWTMRNENQFLPLDYVSKSHSNGLMDPAAYGNAFAEYKLFYKLGVDGVFSEQPDTALEARDK
jgi:glycerophosphoryl diester phosphodiesterase